MNRSLGLAAAIAFGAVTMAVAIVSERGEDARVGIATLNAAPTEVQMVRGEAQRKMVGDLSIYVPPELATRNGRFDVVVHFHGAAKNQEQNVDEAQLHAAVVSVNEGAGSTSYARKFAYDGGLDRVLAFAERQVDDRAEGARAGRVALSAWSAGGAAVRELVSRDADRIDAVLIADGVFSTYADPKTKEINPAPLAPLVSFARRAENGEKLFVLTHTAIDTPDYPSVKECADAMLAELDLAKAAPPPNAPQGGGAPTYAVDRGSLHILGFDGKGPQDHVDQIKALDAAYAALARRWRD